MLTTNQRMSTDKKRLTPQGQTMGRVAATDMAPQRAARPNPPQAPQKPRAPAVPATKGSRTSPVFQAGRAPMTQAATSPQQVMQAATSPQQVMQAATNPQQRAVNTIQASAPGSPTGSTGNPGIAPQNNAGDIQFTPGSMSTQNPVSAVGSVPGTLGSGLGSFADLYGIGPGGRSSLTSDLQRVDDVPDEAGGYYDGRGNTAGEGGILGLLDGRGPQIKPIVAKDPPPPLVHDDRTYQQMMQDALMERLMGGPQTAEEEALINQMMEAQVGQGVADARANMGGGGFAVGGALGALEGDIRREGSLAASGQIADLRQQEEAAWLEQVLGLSGSLQDERELGIYETAFERALKMLEDQGGGGGGGGGGAPAPFVDEDGNVTQDSVSEEQREAKTGAEDAVAAYYGVPPEATMSTSLPPEGAETTTYGPYTVFTDSQGVLRYVFTPLGAG